MRRERAARLVRHHRGGRVHAGVPHGVEVQLPLPAQQGAGARDAVRVPPRAGVSSAHVRGARRGGASRRGGRSGGERAARLAAHGREPSMRHFSDPARPFGAGGCVRVVRGDRVAHGAQVQRRRDAVDGNRRGGVVPLRRHDLGEVRHGRPARRGARPALELRPFPDPLSSIRR